MVVVADEHHGQLAHGGEVHRLVHVAALGGAVAVPGHRDARLLLDAEGEGAADGDRHRRGQVAGQRDRAEGEVAEVDVAVASARGPVLPAHELGEDAPRLDAAHHVHAHMAVQRRPDIVGPHRARYADRRALVAAPRVERPRDLPLLVEELAALLDAARDQHQPIDAEQVLAVETRCLGLA